MPIDLKTKTFYMKVVKILDEVGQEVIFANINNADVNVDFVPLPPSNNSHQKTQIKTGVGFIVGVIAGSIGVGFIGVIVGSSQITSL